MESTTIQNEHLIVQRLIDGLLKGNKEKFKRTTFASPEIAKKTIYFAVWEYLQEMQSGSVILTPSERYQMYRYDLNKIEFTGKNPVVTELKFKKWCKDNAYWIIPLLSLLAAL
jgi:hypothetical protein